MTTELAICDECGIEAAEQSLNLCALSTPWAPRHECTDCHNDCGPCRDEARREWQAEHYGRRGA